MNTEAEGLLGPAGSYHLRDGTVVGESPLTPYGPLAPRHLARLDGIEHVGDLALISRVDEGTEMVAAFEELIGSHGGLGGWQTRASLLYRPIGPRRRATSARQPCTASCVADGSPAGARSPVLSP